jgi:hypothetical protein
MKTEYLTHNPPCKYSRLTSLLIAVLMSGLILPGFAYPQGTSGPVPGQPSPPVSPTFDSSEFRNLIFSAGSDQEKLQIFRRFSSGPFNVPADTIRGWAEEIKTLDISGLQIQANYSLLFGFSYLEIDPGSSLHYFEAANKAFFELNDALQFLSTATVLASVYMEKRQPLGAEEVLLNAIFFAQNYDGDLPPSAAPQHLCKRRQYVRSRTRIRPGCLYGGNCPAV